jgi:hypothetical protein
MKRFILAMMFALLVAFEVCAQQQGPVVQGTISASTTNCTVSFSCVWENVLPSNAATTTINISGTFSETLLVEESNNGGQTWVTAATLSAVGTTTYSTNGFTDIRVRCSAFVSGAAVVTISTGLNTGLQGPPGPGGGSSSASVPSTAYTFSVSGSTITATPNGSGATCTGTDMAVVFNCVTTANATTGGRLFFKNGVYNINSMTLESATGCSTFDGSAAPLAYAMAFPVNTVPGSVQWLLEGESAPIWQGEVSSATVNTTGVLFNVTPTAVSSVAAGTILAGFWQRPATNCTLVAYSPVNVSNDVHYHNLGLYFPTNTRGNEVAFANYFNLDVEYDNVVADFNISHNAIATGSAPVKGTWNSIGLASTVSGSNNWQSFRNTFATGYNIAYDLQSEHVMGLTMTALYSNFACEFGRSATAVFHEIHIDHFVDQENGAGCIWGPQMIQASPVDVFFDFEFGNDANWYTAPRAKTTKLTETNCNIGTGIIRYETVLAGVGTIAEIPAAGVFTSCGGNFTLQEVTQPLNYAPIAASDTFTRPNAINLGPAWVGIAVSTNCTTTIASNAATVGSGAPQCLYVAQAYNNDQFSKITIPTLSNGVSVVVRGSTSANTYYDYACIGTAGGRQIRKRVAGTFTTLGTTASNCANADTIELKAIGTNLFAYRNGALDTALSVNPVSDASVASGNAGFVLFGSVDTATNWSGGSVPLQDQARSQYSQPFIASTYSTLTNCAVNSVSPAACGSAASGAFVIPTTTATYTVNTTAVTANSVIILTPRTYTGNLPSAPTCVVPTITADPVVSAIVAGTSFTLTETSTTGQTCWNYWVVN